MDYINARDKKTQNKDCKCKKQRNQLQTASENSRFKELMSSLSDRLLLRKYRGQVPNGRPRAHHGIVINVAPYHQKRIVGERPGEVVGQW